MNGLLVSFDEPPPSPIEHVSFDPEIFSVGPDIISPKRKQRKSKGPSTKKRKVSKIASTAVASSQGESRTADTRPHSEEITQAADVSQNSTPIEEDLFSVGFPASTCRPSANGSYDSYDDQINHNTKLQTKSDNSPYEAFVEAVFAAECDLWQISRNLFIVNGWNREANTATNTFYHLQMVLVGVERRCHCLCPEGKQVDECFHIRFIKDHGDEKFPANHRMTGEETQTFLFSRNVEQYEPIIYYNIFSVPTPRAIVSIKNRAIVQHFGEDTGTGTWRCSRDPILQNCDHILAARDSLQQHIQLDVAAKDVNADRSSSSSHYGVFIRELGQDMPAVSYKMIPPPQWARISSDAIDLPSIPVPSQPPQLIQLTPTSSCACKSDLKSMKSMYNPDIGKNIQPCEVYGLTRMWHCKIEVQKCPSCKYRFIGPDCREFGLFNWNNRVLVSHDLLDDYTSSFSTSETPFVAWTAVLMRRYDTYQSPLPFLSEKRFRVIWFAYARLLNLDNDMRCTKCGPTPKVTIWDGVTLAFSRKNLKPSLCPPTTIHEKSKVRPQARHPNKPQCFQDVNLRKTIHYVLTGPPLRYIDDEDEPGNLFVVDDDPSDDDTEEATTSKQAARAVSTKSKAIEDMQKRIEQVENVISQFESINTSLAGLFTRCYGRDALLRRRPISPAYTALFLQMASDESILQLTSPNVIEILDRFVKCPTFENASYLNMSPALYKVVMLELSDESLPKITEDLLGLCRWLTMRGMNVLISIIHHEGGEKDAEGTVSPLSWEKTGCFYSMPQIRYRPRYPSIPRDGMSDIGGQVKRGNGCGKYYSEYSQKRLTGGIMVVWCTHAVCYGFHCIPASEGRNEVFSAIYTHWEKAPEIIVYDYACNLAPYIMAREPTFFANTKCLIDHFHSMGHSACGDACRLMTYVATNPDLDKINSSAAECGNSGILRIRKSVSYMTQDHAIIYTKTFLSIRNRLILRKQEIEGRLR